MEMKNSNNATKMDVIENAGKNASVPVRTVVFLSRIALALILLYLLANGLTDYEESEFLFATQSKWVLALLVISVAVFLFSFYRCMWILFQKITDRGHKWVRGLLLVAALCLQGIFLFYYRSSYLFDNAFVTGAASTLAESGTVAEEAVYYMSSYPNQNAYGVLTAVLWKIGSMSGMSRGTIPLLLNFVNLLCLDSATALFFCIVKECKPELTPAKWTFLHLFLFMNPFLYIGVSYYYTITLSMPFVMLLLYFYVKYLRKKEYRGVLVPVLTGVVLGTGYLLRATTIIPAIAIGCVILFYGKKRKKDLLILLTAVICIAGVGKINALYIGLDTKDTAFPTSHWIMMSLTSPGNHNAEDEAYTASFATAAEKKEAVAERIAEKVNAMDGGDFVSLALAKMKNTWGNGSDGYTVFLENCLRTDGLYKWIFGNHKDFFILYLQGYYWLMLLWILYDVITSIIQKRRDSYVFQLTFLGGVLFYLLWETGPQYSLPFLFVLMLLAAYGMDCAVDVAETMKTTENEKTEKTTATVKTAETEETAKNAETAKTEKTANAAAKCKKRLQKYIMPTLQAGCFLFLLLFLVKKYPVFTGMEREESNPVVTQILANEELELKDGETLEQTFRADGPFNQIIFQWRNPDGESDAVYQVEVSGENRGVFYSEVIRAKGQPYSGASIFSFDTLQPEKGEEFTISIRKTEGSPRHNLRFVTYKMGFYDAYPYGKFTINGVEQTRDMLLAVSETKTAVYCSRTTYGLWAALVAVLGILMSVFLYREN